MAVSRGVPLQALANGENVPLGILEPRRFGPIADRDVVPHLDAWHVVLFERDPPRLEFGEFRFDVFDFPVRLARLPLMAPPAP
jgi:hypothetical protein